MDTPSVAPKTPARSRSLTRIKEQVKWRMGYHRDKRRSSLFPSGSTVTFGPYMPEPAPPLPPLPPLPEPHRARSVPIASLDTPNAALLALPPPPSMPAARLVSHDSLSYYSQSDQSASFLWSDPWFAEDLFHAPRPESKLLPQSLRAGGKRPQSKHVSFADMRQRTKSLPDLSAEAKHFEQELPMAVLELALIYVLQNEGNTYVNDPLDHGGPTRYGITQGALSVYLGRPASVQDVQNLTPTMVQDLYRRNYWTPIKADQIQNQQVATVLLDMAVLCGPSAGVKMLQTAVGAVADGVMGPLTLALVNQADPGKILAAMSLRACSYFSAIAVRDPTQAKFLPGWQMRAHKIMALGQNQVPNGMV
ncbi:hypothetical protein Q3G72_006247 [Acer saccharum]|jgi:hypothetical protein|nr:hypothetical protein Q3G72_006247 [Acer saccharum]